MLAGVLFSGLLLVVVLSPVGAYRVAEVLDAVARELRHHGGAMAGAYAAYRQVRRGLAAAARPGTGAH